MGDAGRSPRDGRCGFNEEIIPPVIERDEAVGCSEFESIRVDVRGEFHRVLARGK